MDLPGAERLARCHQLVAGGEDGDDGTAPNLDARRSPARRAPRSWPTTAAPAAAQPGLAPTRVVAERPHECPDRRSPAVGRDPPPPSRRPRRGITASAPGGIGAPVMIRTVVPGDHASASAPRRRRPRRPARSSPGASAARRAKPSIDELANGGTSTSAVTLQRRRHAAGRLEQRNVLPPRSVGRGPGSGRGPPRRRASG